MINMTTKNMVNINDDDKYDIDDEFTAQDVESHHLQLLLSYMYRGQVFTPHDHHHLYCWEVIS